MSKPMPASIRASRAPHQLPVKLGRSHNVPAKGEGTDSASIGPGAGCGSQQATGGNGCNPGGMAFSSSYAGMPGESTISHDSAAARTTPASSNIRNSNRRNNEISLRVEVPFTGARLFGNIDTSGTIAKVNRANLRLWNDGKRGGLCRSGKLRNSFARKYATIAGVWPWLQGSKAPA